MQHPLSNPAMSRILVAMPATERPGRKLTILAILLVAVSLSHYFTPIHLPVLHQILRRLYYIPVLFGSYWFGFRGGLVTAAVSALLYLPHIIFQWGHTGDEAASQYSEIIMFVVVGSITGLLVDRQRRLISQQQEAARELEEAYRQLQDTHEQIRRADRLSAVGQLSAALAHEIRNPLGSIRGAAELLLDDLPDDLSAGEYTDIIRKETARLQRLLDDLLTYARPSAPTIGPVDPDLLTRHVFRLLGQQAEQAGLRLEADIMSDIPPIPADESQLSQVLVNLVLNAIQVSSPGGVIAISTRVPAGRDVLEIVVEDQGPGIPVDDMERLYDPFHTTREGGTGLGLSVVHSIIELHSGAIEASNREKGGARFTLTLPLNRGEEADG